MAKVKRYNADGTTKKKNTKNPNQKLKKREKDLKKLQTFNNRKGEEQQGKDAMARQAALESIGITQDFEFEDHKGIYNYADSATSQAPIKMIDATIQPPEVTSYPEYPIREFSSPPAFNVDRIPAADCSRVRSAKAILQMNLKK